jgi:hypothetical protein
VTPSPGPPTVTPLPTRTPLPTIVAEARAFLTPVAAAAMAPDETGSGGGASGSILPYAAVGVVAVGLILAGALLWLRWRRCRVSAPGDQEA